MRDSASSFRDLGGEPAVISSGTVDQAANLVAELGLDFPVLSDPGRKSFCKSGMRRDFFSIVNFRTLGFMARAWKGGHRQRKLQGDPFQQGGVLIVDPSDKVIYHFVSTAGGHHPEIDDLIDALKQN